MFRIKQDQPSHYRVRVDILEGAEGIFPFSVTPPINFESQQAKADLERLALNIADTALDGHSPTRGGAIRFTHTSADQESTLGHVILPNLESGRLNAASFVLKDALHSALNGTAPQSHSMGSEM